jgi:hypothetical protein
MKLLQQRDVRHFLGMCFAPLLLALAACSSGVSGHAPGLAGQQALDPGTFTYPLAYIKRPFPKNDIDVADLITSTTGGDVYVREQASAGGAETNITAALTKGKGDVRDLDVSMDGKLLIFSLRLPLTAGLDNTDPKQPTWKIYQYDAGTKLVTQLTNDDQTAGHDIGAHYLPDGRIVFSSTRQAGTQGLLLDQGGTQFKAQTANGPRQPIFLLHVMNADGTNIHQISFNTHHDFAPSVLADGTIVFSRYDSANGGHISLYHTHEDGTGLELLYGANSHNTGAGIGNTNNVAIEFLNARQRADFKIVAIARPFGGTQLGGDIVQIDTDHYVECNQTITPSSNNGTCDTARPGQSSATSVGVTTDPGQASLAGRFASVYPLYDGTNRMLVSWSPCFVLDNSVTPAATRVCTSSNISGANVQLAPPAYTIWIYDSNAGTLSPLLAAPVGLTIVDPVVLQARTPKPTFDPDTSLTGEAATLANNTTAPLGILEIRSVYDFDGVDSVAAQTKGVVPDIATLADPSKTSAAQRPARFIRIEKAVEIPDDTVRAINPSAFGPTGEDGMGMRDILAYAPIEPDGSVRLQLPAKVPFTIEILDANARRINPQQHTSWLQLMPGETKICYGCHTAGATPTTTPSHGRTSLTSTTGLTGLTASVNGGASAPGAMFPGTGQYPAAARYETMAATRAGDTCTNGAASVCSEVASIDVIYKDVWSNPATTTPSPPLSYAYADLTTQAPNNAHCTPWDALCRSTINYPLHIQPIWNFVRPATASGVVPTCVTCHNKANATAVQVPAGQLDLTDSTSDQDGSVVTSYEQLMFAHNAQELNMGTLQVVMIGNPPMPQAVAMAMLAGSANGSTARFFSLFSGTYTGPEIALSTYVDHTGFLKPAELRLISEWLDIGAQYYNSPFAAPAN